VKAPVSPLEREHTLAWLGAIVESSDDAIVATTPDEIITSWNPAAERLYGYSAAEAVGQKISLIIPPDRVDEQGRISDQLRRGEPIEALETVRVRKNGTRIDISLSLSPMRNQAGALVGQSRIGRDITERRRAQAERERDAIERLQVANERLGAQNEELARAARRTRSTSDTRSSSSSPPTATWLPTGTGSSSKATAPPRPCSTSPSTS